MEISFLHLDLEQTKGKNIRLVSEEEQGAQNDAQYDDDNDGGGKSRLLRKKIILEDVEGSRPEGASPSQPQSIDPDPVENCSVGLSKELCRPDFENQDSGKPNGRDFAMNVDPENSSAFEPESRTFDGATFHSPPPPPPPQPKRGRSEKPKKNETLYVEKAHFYDDDYGEVLCFF